MHGKTLTPTSVPVSTQALRSAILGRHANVCGRDYQFDTMMNPRADKKRFLFSCIYLYLCFTDGAKDTL